MIAETQRRRLLAPNKVGVKLHLAAQGDTGTDPFGLASLGVADRLRAREDVPGASDGHKEHAVVIAQDTLRTP